ncbi:MAG: DNA alkylation repair protein [Fusobacteria bacterium]|nr:MAG: DNA alkylation repair protein [Fusobacteriota bacterium]KAF0228714.1 MAG: DNA alkylation repair [Fusobacteriota bacterium]
MWYKNLFDELVSLRDQDKAIEMSKYMRNQFSFIGVPRPQRSFLYKKFYRDLGKSVDWDFVNLCFSQKDREYQYLAIDYLNQQKKLLNIDDLSRIYNLIKIKSWWDSVDGFPRIVGEIVKSNSNAKSIMLKWSTDENIWIRRVAILHQLLFKEMTDTKLLEKIIVNNLGSKEIFINKAIGWILRDYSKTMDVWVIGLIDKYRDRLDKLSIREGSKYI